jgi:hypothetical protein
MIATCNILNAICFLIKPNTEKLSFFFQSCITELLDYLGPNARENITFCFDSEYFRYLVALHQNIPLDDLDENEYEDSWSFSMKESNRLIDYISMDLKAYYIQEEGRQLIKHIQFEIIHMIRPMLEAMRDNILWVPDLPSNLIQLHPKAIYRRATQCLACKSYPMRVGKSWIIPDFAHEIHNTFLIGLTRMIDEEKNISGTVESNDFNLHLFQQLESVLYDYKRRMNKMRTNQSNTNLPIISSQIKAVGQLPMVYE